ncbi:MAG: phosphate/phosphite/phosphonate ABC transporter substrate-binding protein, partial [Verrucomicrobiota bacterium]
MKIANQPSPKPFFLLASLLPVFVVLLFILAFSGCAAPEEEVVEMPNGELWPAKVKLAFTPSSEDPERRMTMYDEIAEYLSGEIGIEVELVRSSSYAPMIEAMRSKKIDIAQTGSMAYLLAHNKAGAEAIVTRGLPGGVPGIYHSAIVTSPKSGLNSLEEVQAKAKDLTLSFTAAASTSGHLVPRTKLESMGLVPERDFAQVV